jgi:hypothetical protein
MGAPAAVPLRLIARAMAATGIRDWTMLIGYIDRLDRHFLTGWAVETEHPDDQVEISVLVNGQEWGRITADNLRVDLREHGSYGDGRHGFTYLFDKPISVLATYNISVVGHYGGKSWPLSHKSIQKISSKQKTPILITANGRSGTTILMKHLRSSPSIVIPDKYPYELKLLTYYCKAFDILSSTGNPDLSMKDDEMYLDPYHLGLNPFNHHGFQDVFQDDTTVYDFFEHKAPPKLATAFQSIISDFYDLLAERIARRDATYFAEKCDILHPTRNFVRFTFEDFREIVLVRDPRDVFCSYRSFWKSRPEEALQALKNAAEKTLQIVQSHERSRVIFIRYEDLVFNNGDTLSKISEFLELGHPPKPDAASDADLFMKHGTSKDAASSVGRWKEELSTEEIGSFAAQFAGFFEAFGYERVSPAKAAPSRSSLLQPMKL